MSGKKKDVTINLRMTSDLKKRLKAQAERENRSVSNLIETVVVTYLDKQKRRRGQ